MEQTAALIAALEALARAASPESLRHVLRGDLIDGPNTTTPPALTRRRCIAAAFNRSIAAGRTSGTCRTHDALGFCAPDWARQPRTVKGIGTGWACASRSGPSRSGRGSTVRRWPPS